MSMVVALHLGVAFYIWVVTSQQCASKIARCDQFKADPFRHVLTQTGQLPIQSKTFNVQIVIPIRGAVALQEGYATTNSNIVRVYSLWQIVVMQRTAAKFVVIDETLCNSTIFPPAWG